ncbi:MAG: heme exporter protein CcmD [Rhodospirillales bacterium]|nr:heme exporter protein CcmD [Rhodospirillales bacterium]
MMQEFLSMGGYGAYVWPSYVMSAVLLVALLAASVRGLKSTETEFDRLRAANAPQKQKQETESLNGDEA